ncbi:hypothetical protein [Methanobrevibacter sp. V74]|uniref:hypothetical protein n=1 Tax=Methanobrevibacter sp. V74 TaxID=3064279 RepID=UPI002732B6E7|nr:hypothetical protein [Methanobrevibacter sp. V74]
MNDGITVISQTTAERRAEIKELFIGVKPFLEQGLSLKRATLKVKPDLSSNFSNKRWYKDLRDYCEEQGYRRRY